MDFSGKRLWIIIAIIAIGIIALIGMLFLPKQAVGEGFVEKKILEPTSNKILINGEIVEGIKECGAFNCFKIKVMSSIKEEFINKVKEIKTDLPIKLKQGVLYDIFVEEKNGELFAEWFDIQEAIQLIENEVME